MRSATVAVVSLLSYLTLSARAATIVVKNEGGKIEWKLKATVFPVPDRSFTVLESPDESYNRLAAIKPGEYDADKYPEFQQFLEYFAKNGCEKLDESVLASCAAFHDVINQQAVRFASHEPLYEKDKGPEALLKDSQKKAKKVIDWRITQRFADFATEIARLKEYYKDTPAKDGLQEFVAGVHDQLKTKGLPDSVKIGHGKLKLTPEEERLLTKNLDHKFLDKIEGETEIQFGVFTTPKVELVLGRLFLILAGDPTALSRLYPDTRVRGEDTKRKGRRRGRKTAGRGKRRGKARSRKPGKPKGN